MTDSARMSDLGELKIAIANGPKCPLCGWDGFDDWWHDPSVRSGNSLIVGVYADVRCEECDISFDVTRYHDGETHSSWRAPT